MVHTRKAESQDFVETVQGTFGTAVAADTIVVVKRSAASRTQSFASRGETSRRGSSRCGSTQRLAPGRCSESPVSGLTWQLSRQNAQESLYSKAKCGDDAFDHVKDGIGYGDVSKLAFVSWTEDPLTLLPARPRLHHRPDLALREGATDDELHVVDSTVEKEPLM